MRRNLTLSFEPGGVRQILAGVLVELQGRETVERAIEGAAF